MMFISRTTERVCKMVFLAGLATLVVTYFYKDRLPDPGFYDTQKLVTPTQTPTSEKPFALVVNKQNYVIKPRYDYDLNGVIVSYSNADGFGNITHHDRWKDFINLRDLCVIWGDNVKSGIYKKMTFSSDSWTCWVHWSDPTVYSKFRNNALSNNHLLTDNLAIKRTLMKAQVGDQIRIQGVLAEYANPENHFNRGTSITRDDRGNGACETIYVQRFDIIKRANAGLRGFYVLMMWVTGISLAVWLLLFFLVPHQKY
ncbi:hypothetical protein [Legionella spiritensis]|nr:hypothetical protein [Legionella spiritensis]